jgi:hypothetical protein
LRVPHRAAKLSEQPALGIEKSVCPDQKCTGSQLGEAGERGFNLRTDARVQDTESQSKMDRSSRSRACNAFEQTRCLGGTSH